MPVRAKRTMPKRSNIQTSKSPEAPELQSSLSTGLLHTAPEALSNPKAEQNEELGDEAQLATSVEGQLDVAELPNPLDTPSPMELTGSVRSSSLSEVLSQISDIQSDGDEVENFSEGPLKTSDDMEFDRDEIENLSEEPSKTSDDTQFDCDGIENSFRRSNSRASTSHSQSMESDYPPAPVPREANDDYIVFKFFFAPHFDLPPVEEPASRHDVDTFFDTAYEVWSRANLAALNEMTDVVVRSEQAGFYFTIKWRKEASYQFMIDRARRAMMNGQGEVGIEVRCVSRKLADDY